MIFVNNITPASKTTLMKKVCILTFSALIFCFNISKGQRLTTGFFSGINLSDIHGNYFTGKWVFKPGPVQGFFADYSFLKSMGFKTGVEYSTLYYKHKVATLYPPIYYDYSSSMYYSYSSSSRYSDLAPYYSGDQMDLSYLTIPMQLRLTIPSKPDLNLSAGIYYAFLTAQNPEHGATFKSDFGYMFSAGVAYPFSDDFSGLLNARYNTGKKELTPSYKNGSFDFTIGVAFNGFLKGNGSKIITPDDTSSSRLRLEYFTGVNINQIDDEKSSTGKSYGFSAGLKIDLSLSDIVAFRTGLSFEQKGYSFKDSSDYTFATIIERDARYKTDTRVTIDYIEIPAQFRFYLGRSRQVYFSTGPWLAFKLNARSAGTQLRVENLSQSYRLLKTTVYDDITGILEGTDTGWTFSTGIEIPVGHNRCIDLGVEYKHGFSDVYKGFNTPSATTITVPEIRNRSLSLHLGFVIPGRRN
jgi:opacity protein-like surface antigen